MNIVELRKLYNTACQAVQRSADAIEKADATANLTELRTSLDEAVAEAERTKANMDSAVALEGARSRFTPVEETQTETETRTQTQTRVDVGSEPLIYARHNNRTQSFFSDLYRRDYLHDSDAGERLHRHARQMIDIGGVEKRAVGTSALPGLVIPQYLVDLYAPLARAGRPFANCCRSLPLPAEGMTLNVPRQTTGTATAIQASENANVQNTDGVATNLQVNVRTVAGQQDISRQSLERGEPGIDELLFADLLADYATKLDSQIINADGTLGTHLGVLSTVGIMTSTYTDASPTVPKLYSKLSDILQQIASARFMGADHIIMHPRRWGWITAALDSQNRPLVVPTAIQAFNPAATGDQKNYGGVVGQILGLPVVTDANIPTNLGAGTNQDPILACRCFDHLLWEEGDGTPRQARFEQTLGNQLTVKIVVYGYSAFTAGRYPAASGIVNGTGLITPTF
jgi:HK97 family phage major capsid protein